ncbi:3-dehydroquinate synthase [Flavobacteriaceae bacterium MHTCC 0001]
MYHSKVIKQSIQVTLNFDLIFTNKIFDTSNPIILDILKNRSSRSKAIVVVDQGVTKAHTDLKTHIISYFNFYSEALELSGEILEILGGEQSKNDESHIQSILEMVNANGIDRHSYIIAIGGGAVLDAVGYAAAIAHRGIRLVRIPTTVLSQNDSGVGVKNGINYFGKKNFIGTFAVPHAVVNDSHFLTTLHDRDWRSGISEAIKVALIKDYPFFEWIEKHSDLLNTRDEETMQTLIYKCADIHMKHIQNSGDPFEQGSSRPLDFGHWAAHKIEQLTNYKIRHGEAVAIGIAIDSTYSYLNGFIEEAELIRILKCFTSLGFNITNISMKQEIIEGLEEFREHLGGKLTIMILKSLGEGFEVNSMNKQKVLKSIDYLNGYH